RLRSIAPTYRPQINIFESLRLRLEIELLSDDFCAVARDARKKIRILRRIEQRVRYGLVIALAHQHAAHAVLHCFRYAAMVRRKYWQTTGHCFEHRIWNAFYVSIMSSLARVHKNVRAIINVAQLLLRNETGERNASFDV